MLHPLTFTPILKRTRWGGRKLGSMLGKAIGPEQDYAESWEIADHADGMSTVDSGPLAGTSLSSVVASRAVELFGTNHPSSQFPLLIKYLDANDWLSLQVHPDDALASKYSPTERGKTEAWVILDAALDSRICAGLQSGVTESDLRSALTTGRIEPLLNLVSVKAGDCFFVPAGTVHALGPGIVLAEVQQQSNLTFRLHDWGRLDANGLPRPIHVEDSLRCTNFDRGPVGAVIPQPLSQYAHSAEELVACEHFVIRRHTISEPTSLSSSNQFRILMLLSGQLELKADSYHRPMSRGATILLPASVPTVQIDPCGSAVTLLEVTQPLNATGLLPKV